MARWIVFDQVTASELRSRLPQEAVYEAPGRAALEYALANPKSLVTVLPLAVKNASAIAIFRPRRPEITAPMASSAVRATGFLGLSDEPMLTETEEVAAKMKWWQRLWRG
jgi:hypothetical protein